MEALDFSKMDKAHKIAFLVRAALLAAGTIAVLLMVGRWLF